MRIFQLLLVLSIIGLAGALAVQVIMKTAPDSAHSQAVKYSQTHDMSDPLARLELRRLLGPSMRQVAAGRSECASCRWPWPLVTPHDIDYEPSRGMFAICDTCFYLLKSMGRYEEIEGYYLALGKSWGDSAPMPETIHAAVFADFHRR